MFIRRLDVEGPYKSVADFYVKDADKPHCGLLRVGKKHAYA